MGRHHVKGGKSAERHRVDTKTTSAVSATTWRCAESPFAARWSGRCNTITGTVRDTFANLLRRFAQAIEQNDGARLAALFAPAGVYDDYFFGPHRGAAEIGAMLQRFHDGGKNCRWDFFEPLSDGRTGYARYRFSYRSSLADTLDRPVAFEGMCRILIQDGLIEHYAEVFDRGVAFVQLGFAPERITRILARYTMEQNFRPEFHDHLARFTPPPP